MTDIKIFFFFPFLLTALFLYSCGTTTDTVEVVREGPRTAQTNGDEEEDTEGFQQLTIGVMEPVTNFDPLFARSLSTKRVLSLLYEGLFTLDESGEPVSAIASEYELSDDGLTYTFKIDRDIFYHDNTVFTAGVGRRINARDIKWAFERTARLEVPPMARELLMGIRGYENYYLEQSTIFDPNRRVLEGVRGIEVVDAETVRISLYDRDPDFLKKLASPYLYIYPREAVEQTRGGLPDVPVGTGPYTYNQPDGDSRFILVRNDSENNQNRSAPRPSVNRINLAYFASETELFQEFAASEIDFIPELGPQTMEQVVTDSHELRQSYVNNYRLSQQQAERITSFYIHQNSVVNNAWLLSRLKSITAEDIAFSDSVSIQTDGFPEAEEAEPQDEYYITYTDNPFARKVLNDLHLNYFQPESSLVFFDIRIPTRRTSIYTETSDSYRQKWKPIAEDYWLRIDTKMLSLYHRHVNGVKSSPVPWKIFIQDIRVDESERTVE